MNSLTLRRLNRELVDWEFTDNAIGQEEIVFFYKGAPIVVKLHDYPFKPPRFQLWPHERYYQIAPFIDQHNIRRFIGTKCLHCQIYDDWTPSYTIHRTLQKFIQLDKFISNCVKLNFVFQNKLNLPEDMLHIIWSYLNDYEPCLLFFG
jgi:hypothetical protein